MSGQYLLHPNKSYRQRRGTSENTACYAVTCKGGATGSSTDRAITKCLPATTSKLAVGFILLNMRFDSFMTCLAPALPEGGRLAKAAHGGKSLLPNRKDARRTSHACDRTIFFRARMFHMVELKACCEGMIARNRRKLVWSDLRLFMFSRKKSAFAFFVLLNQRSSFLARINFTKACNQNLILGESCSR